MGGGDDDNGFRIIDDEAQGKPPYITFNLNFREDPKITKINQRMAEENKNTKTGAWVTRISSNSILALPAISEAEGTFFHVRVHQDFLN